MCSLTELKNSVKHAVLSAKHSVHYRFTSNTQKLSGTVRYASDGNTNYCSFKVYCCASVVRCSSNNGFTTQSDRCAKSENCELGIWLCACCDAMHQ
jgi:hypothetical protein